MIIWSARPQRGPLSPLGEYQVSLKTAGVEKSTSFELEMDPNLEGITKEDLQKQFDLAIQIRDKVSEANEAVILIREVREQATQFENAEDAKISAELAAMLEKMKLIEENLYQVQNQSGQDPLNFPIKLNNRLASLQRSVENGQAKPTDAAYVVFEELSKELACHLAKLDQIIKGDLKTLNDKLPQKITIEKK